jgi:hypothetical protein
MRSKNIGMVMALAGLAMMNDGANRPRKITNPNTPPEPNTFRDTFGMKKTRLTMPDLDVDLSTLHKGHKITTHIFEFTKPLASLTAKTKYHITIGVQFSYSTAKKKVQNLNRLEKQLENFISKTDISVLSKIERFEILEIPISHSV